MRIAFITFNKITWLDFIGIYDPLSRLKIYDYLPDLSWDICSYDGNGKDLFGLEIISTRIKPDLSEYDVIIIPGGHGTRDLVNDAAFVTWIKTASSARYKISICTGSLILGAAGFLENKKATTHFQEYDHLKNYCASVVKERIVEDGDSITAGAVSSSIDLGLYLCKKWAGDEAAEVIRTKMDYKH